MHRVIMMTVAPNIETMSVRFSCPCVWLPDKCGHLGWFFVGLCVVVPLYDDCNVLDNDATHPARQVAKRDIDTDLPNIRCNPHTKYVQTSDFGSDFENPLKLQQSYIHLW